MRIGSLSKIEEYFKIVFEKGRLVSSYIFTGGGDKFRIEEAKFLAKLVNCTGNPKPCGYCSVCQKIDEGIYGDVLFIESEKRISIGIIRYIQKFASLKSFSSPYKVVIINEAQYLTPDAANAFLKILEEPPSHVIFILLTSELRNILPTIISRCQVVRLKIRRSDKEKFLSTRVNLSLDQIRALATLSALKLKESEKIVKSSLWARRKSIFEKQKFIHQLSPKGNEKRKEFSFLLQSVLYFLRDVLIIKLTGDEEKIISQDLKTYICDYSRHYDEEDLIEKLQLLFEVYSERENINLNVAYNLVGGLLWRR